MEGRKKTRRETGRWRKVKSKGRERGERKGRDGKGKEESWVLSPP